MLKRIYLDHSATTPVDPEVVEAMMPYLTSKFGNASSIHHFGQETRAAVDKARHQVASLINCRPNEIVFTSGGTESSNLAIQGLLEYSPPQNGHIITSTIEHPSVRSVCEDLEKLSHTVTYLPVYDDGIVRIREVESAITEHTVLISIMTANNEIGTLQPVIEIGKLVRLQREKGRKIRFHTDAVQAVGKIIVDVNEIGCDLLSLSGHKIYAPKGVGALFVRRGTRLHPQNIGGRQERGLRGGTESVPLIVALGKAAELAQQRLEIDGDRMRSLRDTFEDQVLENISGSFPNGHREHRLPNISSISFSGIEGEGLLINLDMQGIAVSTGSACSSGSLEPSPVIRAIGRDDELARGAIRFSFGKDNTSDDVERVLEKLPASIERLRRLTPSRVSSAQ
ncbi:MAG TPA: cysteine desulfurase family protein [Pyrinomonadaceae bacterium]|nr:cysteine desulfurase family protein [Pyrinomonadaceae bacterium]